MQISGGGGGMGRKTKLSFVKKYVHKCFEEIYLDMIYTHNNSHCHKYTLSQI